MRGAFHQRVPADSHTPKLVSGSFQEWLNELRWPQQEMPDIVLALGEAVSNACEHAYPVGLDGVISIRVECLAGPNGTRRLILTIADTGAWRDPPARIHDRRHGMAIMRATTDFMHLDGTAAGTRIKLISRPAQLVDH
ncbi:ATP-binding protein [Pseudonocardia sp. Cha107L01]|uniref:ATP-binding protein n=1 Tax=Pseudonocardia sp. Cha107L01 TaxID=3457576 RepID=UPI00403EA7F8